LRILHVDTGREMRGGQRQVLFLLKGMQAAGVDSMLLARPESPLAQSAAQAGFAVLPVSAWNLCVHSKAADLVHAHDARAHTLAACASRVPFVVSRRVAFPVKDSLASRWKYRRALRFLAVSQFVAAELERAGVSKESIDIVYDCTESGDEVGEWRVESPAVALATHDPLKGRDLITQAAQLVGIPVKYSDNLQRDLQHASMFVYITRSEGLGSAALFAMAMGIPVIGSNVGGLPEALAWGEAGLLTANEPSEIARAMQRMRDDSALAQTLIEQGKRRVADHFTVQRMVNGTRESYRRALAG
jgi:hypothetical protein